MCEAQVERKWKTDEAILLLAGSHSPSSVKRKKKKKVVVTVRNTETLFMPHALPLISPELLLL